MTITTNVSFWEQLRGVVREEVTTNVDAKLKPIKAAMSMQLAILGRHEALLRSLKDGQRAMKKDIATIYVLMEDLEYRFMATQEAH